MKANLICFISLSIILIFSSSISCCFKDDRYNQHGFVIMPHKTIKEHVYLSHLPSYESPHDYQFVFEAQMQANTELKFNKFYSAVSVLTSLTALVNGTQSEFVADLLDGYSHKDIIIEKDINLTIINRIYSKQLNQENEIDLSLDYIIYGGNQSSSNLQEYETYMTKLIGGANSTFSNYDHVIQANLVGYYPYDGTVIKIYNDICEELRVKTGESYLGYFYNVPGWTFLPVKSILPFSCRHGPEFNDECAEVSSNTFKFLE